MTLRCIQKVFNADPKLFMNRDCEERLLRVLTDNTKQIFGYCIMGNEDKMIIYGIENIIF